MNQVSFYLGYDDDVVVKVFYAVPVKVDYTTFWKRYFYRAWCIEQDEQKRQMIVKGVQEQDDEADFKWDSDDEEDDHGKTPVSKEDRQGDKNNSKQSTDSKGGSDTDFSNISEPVSTEPSLVSPPLKSQTDGDDWVKADAKKKTDNEDDDSDSDWEQINAISLFPLYISFIPLCLIRCYKIMPCSFNL